MWKVGGIKIESAAGRRFFLPKRHENSWKREIFCKSLRTRKFSMGKFFGASTHGIVTHSGFRKCIWKVGTTNFWPCFACPKLGDAGEMRVASKNRAAGLHKLWYPGIRDTSTWSKFGAHGEHGDVFLFSNLGALWFSENLIRYSLHVCLREVKNNLFSFKHSYLRHFSWRF